MVKCHTCLEKLLYCIIRIVVTGVVKCQTNIIIYNDMACIGYSVCWFTVCAFDHSAAPRARARALRHLANITAIKDGGLYRWTMVAF